MALIRWLLPVVLALPPIGCDPTQMLGDLLRTDPKLEDLDAAARRLGFSPTGDGGYVRDAEGVHTTIAADGTVSFRGQEETGFTGPADFRVRADREGASAQAQLELLEVTATLRRVMSTRWYDDLVGRSLETLDAELATILDADHLSMEQRRALIHQRWLDVDGVLAEYAATTAESAIEDIAARRRDAVAQARARIETFVRTRLPAGSPDAYRREELERLNEGRAFADRFDPYGPEAVVG